MKTGFRNTLWMGAALALMGAGGCGGADNRIDLTVGTYGEHIYLYSFDCRSLEFTARGVVEAMDASYVLEEGDMIFAVSECGNGSGVCSFHKGADGALRKTSDLRQTGNDERHMMTADYSGGSVSVFPIKDGTLKDRCAQLTFSGSGPVIHRQEGPHIHQLKVLPDNDRIILASDLGADVIRILERMPRRQDDTGIQNRRGRQTYPDGVHAPS